MIIEQSKIKHGTKWSYDKKSCRCNECKKAKADYRRKLYPEKNRHVTTNLEKGTRICYVCKIEKKLEDFTANKNRRVSLGRMNECKSCHNKRGIKNKAKPTSRYSTYKSGSKYRGIEFNLTYEEFMTHWNNPCTYCGEEVETIGLDRIKSEIGYQIDNVVSCCRVCNKAKGVLSQKDFISMCLKISEKFKNHIVSSV